MKLLSICWMYCTEMVVVECERRLDANHDDFKSILKRTDEIPPWGFLIYQVLCYKSRELYNLPLLYAAVKQNSLDDAPFIEYEIIYIIVDLLNCMSQHKCAGYYAINEDTTASRYVQPSSSYSVEIIPTPYLISNSQSPVETHSISCATLLNNVPFYSLTWLHDKSEFEIFWGFSEFTCAGGIGAVAWRRCRHRFLFNMIYINHIWCVALWNNCTHRLTRGAQSKLL